MVHRIVRIDVHKRMLVVVVADVGSEGEYRFGKRKFGASPGQLRRLAEWLIQQEVEEAVMESTTQYWKPVWRPGRRSMITLCEIDRARQQPETAHALQQLRKRRAA